MKTKLSSKQHVETTPPVSIFHVYVLFLQVFHNCTCVSEMKSPAMNMSAVLGQCPRKTDCDRIFKIYMALSVTGSFISACGGTPGYIVMLRSETLKLFVVASNANISIMCGPPLSHY